MTPDVRLVVSLNGSWHPEAALPRLEGSRYDEYLGPPAAPVQAPRGEDVMGPFNGAHLMARI